ncbi:uncharacterized protein LOC126785698 [Argentina anserina]|uniref:uncharacterized protein LOC126785698 n=1 Tax=Argentina anserina TaxID=57926 RepID=UPI00217639C3|nr:uncharacterized protein LOC126785698 [Potentilla anserina]
MERIFVNTPPPFDGTGYEDWKLMMQAFISAQYSKSWRCIVVGWYPSLEEDAKAKAAADSSDDGDSKSIEKQSIKDFSKWTPEEIAYSEAENKAKNVLYHALSRDERQQIKHCKNSKEVWDALQTNYEGNNKVKKHKLQLLLKEFENLQMKDDETIDQYHKRVITITRAICSLSVRKTIPEDEIVLKVLRSLPSRFETKAITISYAYDLDEYTLVELIGNLRIYEADLMAKDQKKVKIVAFKVTKKVEPSETQDLSTAEKQKDEEKKALKSSWSDDDEEEHNVAFIGSVRYGDSTSDELSNDEDEEVVEKQKVDRTDMEKQFKALQKLWIQEKEEMTKKANKLKKSHSLNDWSEEKRVMNLEMESLKQQEKLCSSEDKLKKFQFSSDTVSKIIKNVRPFGSTEGLGYSKLKDTFVRENKDVEEIATQSKYTSKVNFATPSDLKENNDKYGSKFIHTCHFCGQIGHYKSKYSKLRRNRSEDRFTLLKTTLNEHMKMIQELTNLVKETKYSKRNQNRESYYDASCLSVCLDISDNNEELDLLPTIAICNVALTALADRKEDMWYVDSGCLIHMTGNKNWFSKFDDQFTTGNVTFGDGRKAKVLGQGTVTASNIPTLTNVYYVEGLIANLMSVSQLADGHADVWFNRKQCVVLDNGKMCVMKGVREQDNCYHIYANHEVTPTNCFTGSTNEEELNLWHRRLGHVNFQDLVNISNKECIKGIPKLKGTTTLMCKGCKLGKQIKTPHKVIHSVITTKVLELLHMDLIGPAQPESNGGKSYILVVVDDFSRYTWLNFLKDKTETFDVFQTLSKTVINEKSKDNVKIIRIRTDNGTEFKNSMFDMFCSEQGIFHEYSAPITPQHNGVVERKNRSLLEMARVMLHYAGIKTTFWAEAVSTACHTINRDILRTGTDKTPYELWKGKQPNIKYFHVFGSPCLIYKDRDYLSKFEPRSVPGVFLGYSVNSRAYRVFNKETKSVVETINVAIDDNYIRHVDEDMDLFPLILKDANTEVQDIDQNQNDKEIYGAQEVIRPGYR